MSALSHLIQSYNWDVICMSMRGGGRRRERGEGGERNRTGLTMWACKRYRLLKVAQLSMCNKSVYIFILVVIKETA